MEKIRAYEQYSEVLAAFKKDKARCSTNKLMTRDEITALIEAGKLYYAEIDGVLWFFVNEEYFYTANFYAPSDTPIRMRKQDMDVVVELTGNQTRYNEQWERELIAAGYEKGDKRMMEWGCQLDDVIDYVQEQLKTLRAVWGSRGFTRWKAVKADYPEIRGLLEDKIGKDRHTIIAMTDAQLEEMERFGRCSVIRGPEGSIRAASIYFKQNKTAYGYMTATYYMGLGAWASYERYLNAYQEGCVRTAAWIREDNQKSMGMGSHVLKPTGKFYWQFICRAR